MAIVDKLGGLGACCCGGDVTEFDEVFAVVGRRLSFSRISMTGALPPDTLRGCRCLEEPSLGPGGPN
jgi:hypothetical protein